MSFQVSIYDRFIWISIYAYFFVDLHYIFIWTVINKKKREKKKKKIDRKKTKKFYIQSKNCHKFFKTQCLACDIVRKDLFNNNSVSNTDFSGFSNIYFKTKKQLRHMQVIKLNFVKINFQQSVMWWLIQDDKIKIRENFSKEEF